MNLIWVIFSVLLISGLNGFQAQNVTTDNEELVEQPTTETRNVRQKIKKVLNKFRNADENLLDELIPERVKIPSFNVSQAVFAGQFKNISLTGLQTVKIEELSTDFVNMAVDVVISFSSLSLNGYYQLEVGSFIFTNNYEGGFSLVAERVIASGNAYLNTTNSSIVVGNVDIDLTVNDTSANFENLLGGYSIVNGIIGQLSGILFDSAKTKILTEIKKIVREKVNQELKKIPESAVSPRADKNAPIDYMLTAAAAKMKEHGLDPFKIPFIRESFSKKIVFVNFRGEVRIADGTLEGLSTIHRSGDIELNLDNGTLVLEANLGFNTLKGEFMWGIHFMKLRQYGRANVHIKHFALSVKMSQKMEKGAHPILNRLKITDLGQIWIDLKGLGSLEFIFEYIINLMSNALKSKLVRAIEKAVKKELQDEFTKISLPF